MRRKEQKLVYRFFYKDKNGVRNYLPDRECKRPMTTYVWKRLQISFELNEIKGFGYEVIR